MIFKILDDGTLTIDKVEARTISCVNELVRRDRGGKLVGDHDGRKKYMAFAELLYVYLVHSPLSLYRDLSEKERRAKAKIHIGVNDEWAPDDKVAAVEDYYIETLKLSGTYKAYISANRAIYAIGQDIDLFNEQKARIRKKLEKVQSSIDIIEDKEALKDLLDQEESLTKRLMTITNNIQTITSKLNDNFESLKQLELKLAEEENANKEEIRGGGTLGNREEL